MRIRFTLFLLLANAAVFFAIWFLETKGENAFAPAEAAADFTVLEISGKNLDKPRVVKFENNRWRIVSPIDWPANLFAVNRIKSQIEFLDKSAGFDVSEVSKHDANLASYGLNDPSYVIRYGNGAKMSELRIGKAAPVGNGVYMLDCADNRVIVADREFLDSLVLDMERLRNQSVFDIPRFEVNAFSVRLPLSDAAGAGKMNFRRIGLVKDAGRWKFDTPIVADADPREVDAFLNAVCQLSAKSFVEGAEAAKSFDGTTLPTSITIEGTNRRRVLLIGSEASAKGLVYARLEGNPTVFTLDSSILKELPNIQNSLREKSFMRFDTSEAVGIDITQNGSSLKLRKLTSGVWDVIGAGADGATITATADPAKTFALLEGLANLRADEFADDTPGENLAPYGVTEKSPKISVTLSSGQTRSVTFGGARNGGHVYALSAKDGAIYVVGNELAKTVSTNVLDYRWRMMENLPENAKITSFRVSDTETQKSILNLIFQPSDSPEKALSALPERTAKAAETLLKSVRAFTVEKYLAGTFTKKAATIEGASIPWKYLVEIKYSTPSEDSQTQSESAWLFAPRTGGSSQIGASMRANTLFKPEAKFVESLFEITDENSALKSATTPEPAAPKKDAK